MTPEDCDRVLHAISQHILLTNEALGLFSGMMAAVIGALVFMTNKYINSITEDRNYQRTRADKAESGV